MDDAQSRLDAFLARFTPEVEALARRLIARMRDRLPGAAIIVYDNYNSLAIGFGPTEKPSHAVVSLAVRPGSRATPGDQVGLGEAAPAKALGRVTRPRSA